MELTKTQRDQMRHALGLNYHEHETRNHYFTRANNADWNDLVHKGYASKRPGWDDEDAYFSVTDQGRKALGLPEKNKNT
ncbi:hypothetical protein TCA2_4423 [Paenibacillus sp. TCA20]|uniref:hypothetical protein n=1 Tax=Paenibacillus sp. TCA20 TaxID=1499968 RepID=UPI0004D4BB22|nr:hypothetical protein [Paenibacillus sp. TCA20]GAK41931.1 hypothetical protein TCA2_4423 [Paenibacillus sp. TCA20]